MLLHFLTVILVIAKLGEFVTFSWWLVFLPSIISIVIFCVAVLGLGFLASRK